MYSQCPDCLARFRVTAAELRAAHGTVRCGRCGSAFDALARLSDTVPAAVGGQRDAALNVRESVPMTPREPQSPAEYHFTADDLEKVFVDAREWQRQYGPAREASNDAGDSGDGSGEPSALLVDETASQEDITLEGERIQIESFEDLEEIDPAVPPAKWPPSYDLDSTDRFAILKPPPGMVFPGEEPDEEPDEVAELIRTVEVGAMPAPPAAPAPSTATDFRSIGGAAEAIDDDMGTRSLARSPGLAWSVGCLVAALALAAQLTHYFRQDLVRHPQIGPALVELYARLGLPLSPHWDPRALQLRQWGEGEPVTAAGRMRVQASITNRATFAQPLPLLRLQLEDRYGEPVATRDFDPREYLKSPASATRMLAAGASAEADLELADPGIDAVGYRLDLCLRESATVLRCAQGPD
jgi:predicted Zn finger-like uncharacterized protein